MLSTVAITGSSISLEGRNLWIIKESPVSASEALGVKAGFQLLLACPCASLCAAGLAWGLGLSLAEGGVLLLFSLAFAGFTALMGLAVNLLFPKLDAVNDMVVVKQSAAAMLSTFGGMGAALACGGAVWWISDLTGELPALGGCAAVLLLGSAGLLRWLHTAGAERFREL